MHFYGDTVAGGQAKDRGLTNTNIPSSINFPCKVCGKNVNDNDQAIHCTFVTIGFKLMCVSSFRNNNKPVKILNHESSLLLKPSENLKRLLNQSNNPSPEDNTDPKNAIQSKF